MFTWWRRFHTPFKLQPKHMWKGRSELLQRIEFGEYECDPLWQQAYLEDYIFQAKVAEIEEKYSRSTRDTIEDRILYERKKMRKRKDTMQQKHLEAEIRLLNQLADALATEFEMTKEAVEEIMETFDGTTRELYYYILAIKNDRQPMTSEELQMVPRTVDPQPRHIMKQSEGKWFPLWKQTVKDKKIW